MSAKTVFRDLTRRRERYNRRQFLGQLLGGVSLLGAAGFFLGTLWRKVREGRLDWQNIPVIHSGPDPKMGHQIRTTPDGGKSAPTGQKRETKILILGGGVAGLSAAWHLARRGETDFRVLELESVPGGNSQPGQNSQVTGYPTGAHYLPVPNRESVYVREFLEDAGILLDYNSAGIPRFSREHLLQAPGFRLNFYQTWLPEEEELFRGYPHDREMFVDFRDTMLDLAGRSGGDGKPLFAMPADLSSGDKKWRDLDKISFRTFARRQGWLGEKLNWYFNYGSLDDYGISTDRLSAWMGIHYYAARRGRHQEQRHPGEYLVWPSGNGFLVKRFLELAGSARVLTQRLVTNIEVSANGGEVTAMETATGKRETWRAEKLIYALPQFQLPYLTRQKTPFGDAPAMGPWLVLNFFCRPLPDRYLRRLAWDSVFYEGRSLGYVSANHQSLKSRPAEYVFTWYYPLPDRDPREGRKKLLNMDDRHWIKLAWEELSHFSPEILAYVTKVEVTRRAHAMALPVPGSVWSPERQKRRQPWLSLCSANADLAGYSVFEEANYHGVRAARWALHPNGKIQDA